MLCGDLVMWFSKTQKTISFPCTEAKYIEIAGTANDVLFARQMLAFVCPPVTLETVAVDKDNSGAIYLATT